MLFRSEIPHGGATWPLGGGRVRASQGRRAFSAPRVTQRGDCSPSPTGLPSHAASPPTHSVPDHPISQLLKKLQCAVYRALYPIVSRGAASALGCRSLPPDADGLLAPGSRRLRPSQSLYCMPSPPEPSPAPRPTDGTSASASIPPPHPGNPDREADGSPAGPPSPLADTSSDLPGKDSSFGDLEQFLATPERRGRGPGGRPEPQPPGVTKEPLLEQLKGTVQDIHDAIGEARGAGRVGSGGTALSEACTLRKLVTGRGWARSGGGFLWVASRPALLCRALPWGHASSLAERHTPYPREMLGPAVARSLSIPGCLLTGPHGENSRVRFTLVFGGGSAIRASGCQVVLAAPLGPTPALPNPGL